ncbi:cupin domain-containing protein [Mumia quercus]|uniref:cupin domain-containing protein n=1 Tax=Mumia quercus TaxID=2976125 RepID=UPI0021D1A98B|nr:cupin domain-containing protein [Mumia quercus]
MHVIDVTTTENLEGAAYGAGISLIQEDTDVEGSGPRLHQHPYAETFVIHAGSALFTVDGEELVGRAGQVIVVPPDTPHKFRVLPGGYRATHVHASDTFETEWLEEAAGGGDYP